jgi:nucleoside-diphosphate-sugar epimerase
MRFLVTGGSGRVGRLLVRRLAQKGEVIIIDKRPLPEFEGKSKFFEADLHDTELLDTIFKKIGKIDAVYHLAASIDYSASLGELESKNVTTTRNMLSASRKARAARFIFMSTSSVYGESKSGRAITEESECKPYNSYGESKLEAEREVRDAGLPHVIIRSSQIFGPQFKEGYLKVLQKLQNEKMKIIGSGKNRIPLIHIDDVVDALMFAGSGKKILNQTVNIDGDYNETQQGFIRMASELLGVREPQHVGVFSTKFVSKLRGRSSGLGEYMDKLIRDRPISIDKIVAYGWKPSVPLRTGMKEVIDSFRKEGVLR